MKLNITILFSLMFTSFLFCQQVLPKINPEKKVDSLDMLNLKSSEQLKLSSANSKIKQRVQTIQMPNAKPKDSSIYATLKGKARNDKPHKILNAIPENEKIKPNK